MALLKILSDNYLKQAQNNAVVPPWVKIDRVGVEPATSATALKERRRKRKGVLL
jgi:hypothetical protein